MTNTLLRNLPVLLLAIILGASLYVAYNAYNAMNCRVDHLSQELYYNINSVNDVATKLSEIESGHVSLAGVSGPCSRSNDGVLEVASSGSEHDLCAEDADSVDDGDVRVISSGETPQGALNSKATPSSIQVLQECVEPECSDEDDVEQQEQPSGNEEVSTYIGQLENYLRSSDDTESVESEISTVSALNGRKKCPNYSSKSVPLGTEVEWNDRIYTSILTKNGVHRWSGGVPIKKG